MRAFIVELVRAVLVAWGKTWRVVIRKKRNLFLTLGGVIVALILWSIVSSAASPAKPKIAEPTATATATIPYSAVTAEPLAKPTTAPTTGTKEAQQGDMGTGPQAPADNTAPALPSHAAVEIPAPTKPAVDRKNQESVAKALATAYLSRPTADWNDWSGWVEDYTSPALVSQLRNQAFQDKSPLTGKAPTRVTEIKVQPADQGSGVDTPVRWSRNLEITVQSGDGTQTVITYAVVLSNTDKGWIVTEAVEKFWTVK